MEMRAGSVGAETRGGQPGPSLAPPFSSSLPSQPLGSRSGPTDRLWAGVQRRQKGRGLRSPQQEKASPPAAARPVRPRPGPAMWGLLLALAAFAPAVEVDLGAPSTSVLGLATTKARSRPPWQPGSAVRGEGEGELPSYPRPLLPLIGCPTLPTPCSDPPQLARLHLTHTTRRTLPSAWWRRSAHAHTLLRGTMAADSAAPSSGQTKSAVLGQGASGMLLLPAPNFLVSRMGKLRLEPGGRVERGAKTPRRCRARLCGLEPAVERKEQGKGGSALCQVPWRDMALPEVGTRKAARTSQLLKRWQERGGKHGDWQPQRASWERQVELVLKGSSELGRAEEERSQEGNSMCKGTNP